MESEVKKETALQVIRQHVPISIDEINTMAKAFYESGMFQDTKSAAQAMVKIQAGQEVGIKPFAAMTGIHIILGKPVIGAGIIASRIKASGKYDYKVVQMDDNTCSIDFYQGQTNIGNSIFTIAEAKKAQTKNLDKFPKNMLFARAISNGVKWYTPDVFDGPVYTPEEMDFKTEDVPHQTAEQKNDTPSLKPDKIEPSVKITQPDDAPFEIPGLWFAKMEKCKTKADVLDVYTKNKETVDAHPELQNLLKETQQKLSQPQAA